MKCPKCKGRDLRPTKIEEDLAVLACDNCRGSLLSLVQYRLWAEEHPVEIEHEEKNTSLVETDETSQALQCPKCSTLMMKFRISSKAENRVDLCACCYDLWLDAGEWQLIKQLEMQGKLPSIFSDFWQNNIRVELSEKAYHARYEEIFGDDYTKIKDIKDWMDGQDKKQAIINFLKTPKRNIQ
jgi:Zn-finger nucleic acid-binding protein